MDFKDVIIIFSRRDKIQPKDMLEWVRFHSAVMNDITREAKFEHRSVFSLTILLMENKIK